MNSTETPQQANAAPSRVRLILFSLALWALLSIPLHYICASLLEHGTDKIITVSSGYAANPPAGLFILALLSLLVGVVLWRSTRPWPRLIFMLGQLPAFWVLSGSHPTITVFSGVQATEQHLFNQPFLFLGIQAVRTVGGLILFGSAIAAFPDITASEADARRMRFLGKAFLSSVAFFAAPGVGFILLMILARRIQDLPAGHALAKAQPWIAYSVIAISIVAGAYSAYRVYRGCSRGSITL